MYYKLYSTLTKIDETFFDLVPMTFSIKDFIWITWTLKHSSFVIYQVYTVHSHSFMAKVWHQHLEFLVKPEIMGTRHSILNTYIQHTMIALFWSRILTFNNFPQYLHFFPTIVSVHITTKYHTPQRFFLCKCNFFSGSVHHVPFYLWVKTLCAMCIVQLYIVQVKVPEDKI